MILPNKYTKQEIDESEIKLRRARRMAESMNTSIKQENLLQKIGVNPFQYETGEELNKEIVRSLYRYDNKFKFFATKKRIYRKLIKERNISGDFINKAKLEYITETGYKLKKAGTLKQETKRIYLEVFKKMRKKGQLFKTYNKKN